MTSAYALSIAGTGVATVALYCTALWLAANDYPFFSACSHGAAVVTGCLSWLLVLYGLQDLIPR